MTRALPHTIAASGVAPTPLVNWGDPRLPERFWQKTSPCPISGCWWWLGSGSSRADKWRVTRHEFYLEGRLVHARRHAFETLIGAIGDRRLLVTCGMDVCCNPSHTRLPLPKSAVRAAQAERQAAKDRSDPSIKWSRHIKSTYGLGRDAFYAMLARQGGLCAICKCPFKKRDSQGRGCVDHCHATGNVRELLCVRCNTGIGYFDESPEVLRTAADYIERHRGDQ